MIIGQRYELNKLMGSSPLGFVYSARHVILGKRVTVKILHPELCDTADKVRRILQALQLRSRLKHENIADITDFGRDGSGNLYLVREFLTGSTLADLLTQKGRLPVKRTYNILRQLCHALHTAHSTGVTHRKLNPRTIFLTTESGRTDVVKVLDFSVVPTGSTKGEKDAMPYLAPEQLSGSRPEDHRVDVYALGVILHEMLTGQIPFRSVTRSDLIVEKMGEPTIDLSTTQLEDSAPAIGQLVTDCLATNPARRPATAAELEQRLFVSGGRVKEEPEDLQGVRAGSYRLVRLLGSGGLGSVWLGEHPVISSKVAIKILHAEMCDSEEAVRRFVTEAQAVNRTDSPHIVKTFDFGKLPDKRDYAVMELLEGETLGQRLEQRGHLDWNQIRKIAIQLLRALDSAHAAGIVHRDLKPENIHLGNDEDNPKVKVLDFGIAKLIDGTTTNATTKRGFCIGTPLYAPPEQLIGEEVGPASDIYALGVVIHEMLTGRPPFMGNLKEVVRAKVEQAPPSLGDLISGLPDRLIRLFDAMLAAQAARRPSASDALAILEGNTTDKQEPYVVLAPPGVDPESQRQFSDIDTVIPPKAPHDEANDSVRDTIKDPIPVASLEPFHGTITGPGQESDDLELIRPSKGRIIALITIVSGLMLGAGLFLFWHLFDLGPVTTDVGYPSAAAQPPALPTRAAPVPPASQREQIVETPAQALTDSELATPKTGESPAKSSLTPRSLPPRHDGDEKRLVTRIKTDPSGARVLLEGRPIGRTPLRLRISRRKLPAEITLEKEGFQTDRRTLEKGKVPRRLKVILKRQRSRWDPFNSDTPEDKKKTEDEKTEDKKTEDKKTEDKKTEAQETENPKMKTEAQETEAKKTEAKKTEVKEIENKKAEASEKAEAKKKENKKDSGSRSKILVNPFES